MPAMTMPMSSPFEKRSMSSRTTLISSADISRPKTAPIGLGKPIDEADDEHHHGADGGAGEHDDPGGNVLVGGAKNIDHRRLLVSHGKESEYDTQHQRHEPPDDCHAPCTPPVRSVISPRRATPR